MQSFLPIHHSERATDWRPDTPPDLSRHTTVYLDTETTGLKWHAGDRPVGIAIHTQESGHYLPFGHRGGGNLSESSVLEWARRELRHKHVVNINTRFDVHMLRVWGVDLRAQGCTFEDVAHSAALLDDHRKSFALDVLANDVLHEGKTDTGPKTEIANLPAWDVAAYAIRDTALVMRLRAAYEPLLRSENLTAVQDLENRVIPVVVEMEANGMPLDVDLCAEWERETRELLESMQWAVNRQFGFSVNPDAPTDMVRVFKSLGIPLTYTEKGAPSFTKDVVKAHAALEPIYHIGKLTDLRSKYITKYLRDVHTDGKIYPTLHQLKVDDAGTVSGRFSCVNPNLQQVQGADKHAREYGFLGGKYVIKELFRPERGVWMAADARQIEYRIFAALTRSASLLRRYDEDPHTDFHNIVGEMITPARPDVTRTEVKVTNFRKIYGGGPAGLGPILGIDEAAAYKLDDDYNRQFPEAKRAVDAAKAEAERHGYVATPLGRRTRFPGKQRTHKALNAKVQPDAADLNKQKLIELYEARHRLGLTMRMTVHDENDGDLEDPAMAAEVQTLLDTQTTPRRVPILWQVKTGPRWADCK